MSVLVTESFFPFFLPLFVTETVRGRFVTRGTVEIRDPLGSLRSESHPRWLRRQGTGPDLGRWSSSTVSHRGLWTVERVAERDVGVDQRVVILTKGGG